MEKNRIRTLVIAGLLTLSVLPPLQAEERQGYGAQIGHKLVNGMGNLTTGLAEIPKSIIAVTNETNVFWGITGGAFQGLINFAGRTASGGLDVLTFPIPSRPTVHPEYVWDDYHADTYYGPYFDLYE